MSGLFGSPPPSPPPPPAPLPVLEAPDPDEEKRKARLEALRRRRRGRQGTIRTSARGLSGSPSGGLSGRGPGLWTGARTGKTLLGE